MPQLDQLYHLPTEAPGYCAGILGAAVLPVVGVGIGVTQMVRGVANTPEAIREGQRGKHWDTVRSLLVSRFC